MQCHFHLSGSEAKVEHILSIAALMRDETEILDEGLAQKLEMLAFEWYWMATHSGSLVCEPALLGHW